MRLTVAVLILMATMGCAGGRGRSVAGWDVLGQRQVNDRADHDIVAVGGARGDYRRIKITVQR